MTLLKKREKHPVIDLFLLPVDSSTEQSVQQENKPLVIEEATVEDLGVAAVGSKEVKKEANLKEKPEVGHDRPEVVVHHVKIISDQIANETSTPPLANLNTRTNRRWAKECGHATYRKSFIEPHEAVHFN